LISNDQGFFYAQKSAAETAGIKKAS